MAMTLEQQRAIALAQAKMQAEQAVQPPVKADPTTNQPPGVPEFNPSVPGYNPQTGEVQKYSEAGSAGMGAANATTLGWGDELASYLGSGLTGVPRKQVLQEMRSGAAKAQSDNPKSYLAGQVGGGVAQAVATGGAGFGLNAARGGATLGKIALGSALDGSLYGGAAGAGNADGGLVDRLKGGGIGAGAGALVGGAVPYVASGLSALLQKIITPLANSPEREAAVQLLAQEGVPVTAGQRTGSNALRYAESELGGSKAATAMEDQAQAFTDAAMRKAGGSGRATSDNMAALKTQIGKQFEDISARNTLKVDRGVLNDMNAANVDYMKVLPTEQKKIFGALGGDIVQKFKDGKGAISGEVYQTIRSRLSRMANNYRTNDPEFSDAIRGLRDALDNGMDRSIRPQDAGAWAQLRQRYGNLKVLEKAAVGGGEDSALGLISPAQLRVAAASGKRGAYARGEGDFADLAKAGQAVMSKLPNSGTAARTAIRNVGIPGASAGVGGVVAGIPGAIAGAALPYAAGRALMSAPVQRYFGNQAAKGGNKVSDALLAALLRDGGIQGLLGSR